MKLKYIVIIPARLKSTRLPNKPLIILKDKPLIYWTWKNCTKVVPKNLIYIATDSKEIHITCKKYGIQSINTSQKHLTGTDRIALASKDMDLDYVINLSSVGDYLVADNYSTTLNNEKKLITNLVENISEKIIKKISLQLDDI